MPVAVEGFATTTFLHLGLELRVCYFGSLRGGWSIGLESLASAQLGGACWALKFYRNMWLVQGSTGLPVFRTLLG